VYLPHLLPADPSREVSIAGVLLVYVLLVLLATKYIYHALRSLGLDHSVAVYYNRKVIHVLAGDVVALLVPHVFSSPLVPTLFALGLAVLTYIPHRTGRLMYWFQVGDNAYEVNFCIAWALGLLVLWLLLGNPYYAVVPLAFMSFGDAVTGVIRNTVYRRRTKSWIGNLGMAVVTSVIGLYYAGYVGLAAAVLASIVEHFEIPPLLDDNALITLVSVVTLLVSRLAGLL
jgi:dolichol kinase